MRVITRIRDRQRSNRSYVEVALARGEKLTSGVIAELPDLGACRILGTRVLASEIAGVGANERVLALHVETLNPSEHVRDVG